MAKKIFGFLISVLTVSALWFSFEYAKPFAKADWKKALKVSHNARAYWLFQAVHQRAVSNELFHDQSLPSKEDVHHWILRWSPQSVAALAVHYDLGFAAWKEKNCPRVIKHFEPAVAIIHDQTGSLPLSFDKGIDGETKQRINQSKLNHFQYLLLALHFSLADCQKQMGDLERSKAEFENAKRQYSLVPAINRGTFPNALHISLDADQQIYPSGGGADSFDFEYALGLTTSAALTDHFDFDGSYDVILQLRKRVQIINGSFSGDTTELRKEYIKYLAAFEKRMSGGAPADCESFKAQAFGSFEKQFFIVHSWNWYEPYQPPMFSGDERRETKQRLASAYRKYLGLDDPSLTTKCEAHFVSIAHNKITDFQSMLDRKNDLSMQPSDDESAESEEESEEK